jgi:hypothetical protein
MSREAALAELGIPFDAGVRVILITNYSTNPDPPRLVSGDIGAD